MNDWGKSVLEQYELEFDEIRRGRGVLLCDTDRGLKVLAPCVGTEKHLKDENRILRALKEQGFLWVDEMIPNKEGNLISEDADRGKYLLKDWFDGNECNVFRYGDLILSVQTLALLHRALRQVRYEPDLETVSESDAEAMKTEPLWEELERHNRELRRIRNYIRKTGRKTAFELCAMKNFEEIYEQAQRVGEQMKDSACEKLYREAVEQGVLCHGNYHYHNVIVMGEKAAVTNFHKYSVQLQIVDLYKFMRKVLEKHNWNVELGRKLLMEYQNCLPITEEEYRVLGLLFAYPEKYWKQMNYYYNSNKAWIPMKNIEKLEKCVEQDKMKQKFTEKVFPLR